MISWPRWNIQSLSRLQSNGRPRAPEPLANSPAQAGFIFFFRARSMSLKPRLKSPVLVSWPLKTTALQTNNPQTH